MPQDVSQPKNILIVRLSAIGDIVFASPLIGALRSRYPRARIVWLVQPESKALLEHHPDLDEIIAWPRNAWQELFKAKRWGTLWSEILAFRRLLRGYQFDMALDLQGLLKSGILAWFSGARERIGLGSREGSQWLMTRVVERGGDDKRIGSEYLHLAAQLGLPTEPFMMQVALSAEDEHFAQDFHDKLGQGYLVIAPFTTRPQKHWIEAHWIGLIPRLRASFGRHVLMLGGPGDRETASRIARECGEAVIDQVGRTSLQQAAALIKHADLLIGVDTGLTHMGIAFNRPTLCLFGSTCPYLDTTRDNAVVIYHKFDCSPCKRNPTCDGRYDCMRSISVDEVLAAAGELLDKEKAAP